MFRPKLYVAVSMTFSVEEYEGHDSCIGVYTTKRYRTPEQLATRSAWAELQDQHSNSEMPNQILIFYIPRTEEEENEGIIGYKKSYQGYKYMGTFTISGANQKT